MNTFEAFAMGEANRGNELMVFDWEKAAEIIRDRKPQFAVAGLYSDYEYTSGVIWENGKIVTNEYTYLASTWAKPMLILDYKEEIECYKMESETPGWDAYTKWPDTARLTVMKQVTTDTKEDQYDLI